MERVVERKARNMRVNHAALQAPLFVILESGSMHGVEFETVYSNRYLFDRVPFKHPSGIALFRRNRFEFDELSEQAQAAAMEALLNSDDYPRREWWDCTEETFTDESSDRWTPPFFTDLKLETFDTCYQSLTYSGKITPVELIEALKLDEVTRYWRRLRDWIAEGVLDVDCVVISRGTGELLRIGEFDYYWRESWPIPEWIEALMRHLTLAAQDAAKALRADMLKRLTEEYEYYTSEAGMQEELANSGYLFSLSGKQEL